MSSDENTEVNVEVIGGAPELWVIRSAVIVMGSTVVVFGGAAVVWGVAWLGCGVGLGRGVSEEGGGVLVVVLEIGGVVDVVVVDVVVIGGVVDITGVAEVVTK
jgi:hypothetical protein